MTRSTSISSYRQMAADGTLSNRRFQVLEALFLNGPRTGAELQQFLPDITVNDVRSRLAELRDRDVVKEIGTRPCSITHKKTIVWTVTGNPPREPKKKTGYNDLNTNDRTDWMTPPDCRELVYEFAKQEAHPPVLMLDACTDPSNPMGAQQFYTPETDGLQQSWQCGGLVWCNHPWSRKESPLWIDKAVAEGEIMRDAHSGELIVLGPSRPDTGWFRKIWGSADAIYFWKGRMTFYHPVSGLPCMAFNKKTKRWEQQPCPVPVQLSYWGPSPNTFISIFSRQGGVAVNFRDIK